MSKVHGRTIPLSLPRRLICDLVHFAKQVPTVPVQRTINVQAVQQIRGQLPMRVSWCPIFTKAYALVAADYPELRRAYLKFPWARLYEHPFSKASVAIERRFHDENGVFFVHLRGPENQPLQELQSALERYKNAHLKDIPLFRRALLINRYPRPLRRLFWWLGLNSSGPKRAQRLGTFAVTVYSGLGAESLHPLSPLTSTLNYGPIGEDGNVNVRIIYDHRVMDGSTVARALGTLEQVMNGEILTELRGLRHKAA